MAVKWHLCVTFVKP